MHSYMTINCTTVPEWLEDFAVIPIFTVAEPNDEVDAYQIELFYRHSDLQELCAKLNAEPKVYEYFDSEVPGLWVCKRDNQ